MIDFLHIKNYKNLKNLELDSLGKVNLFIGKNNTGKTSLLEAISLFVTNGKYAKIDKKLKKRDLILNVSTIKEILNLIKIVIKFK